MMSPTRKRQFPSSCPVCMAVISCLYSLTRTNKTLNRNREELASFHSTNVTMEDFFKYCISCHVFIDVHFQSEKKILSSQV